MKAALLAISLGVIVLIGSAVAWTTYDYSIICTKCLASKHVEEQRLLGLTFRRATSEGESGEDYQRVYSRPCVHVFHRGGFGRRTLLLIACGKTAEGLRYEARDRAVRMAFLAEKRFHDQELTNRTFSIIDRLAPPDEMPPSRDNGPSLTTNETLVQLADYLLRAESVEHWRTILQSAENDFTDKAGRPHGPSH